MSSILRGVVAVNRVPSRWRFALRAAFCMAVPAAVGLALGDIAAGLAATIGGFTALYGSGRPYAYRAAELGVIAVALATAVALGDAAAAIPWLGVVTATGIAAVAVLICQALAIGPPGAYMIALACAAGVGISAEGESPWRLWVLVLAGGAFSWSVHMAGALVRFRGPERAAVAAAERAVNALGALTAEVERERAVDAAARALHESWVVLMTLQPAGTPGAELHRLRIENHRLHVRFAALVSGGPIPDPGAEPEPDTLPFGRPSGWRLVLAAVRGSHARHVAAQVAVAALIAGGIATVLGVERGYWAIAAAVLVLYNGFDRTRTLVRGVQRLLGTLAGLGLAGVVLGLHPQGVWLIVLLLVLQFLIEMLVVRNYALAAVVITPAALTIGSGGRPVDDLGELLLTRGVDTVIGCAVAFAVLLLGGQRYDAQRVDRALADALDACAALVPHLAAGTVTTREARAARRDAQTSAIAVLLAYDSAVAGGSASRGAAERLWPAVTAAQRVTYRMLAACWQLQHSDEAPPLTEAEAARLAAVLEAAARFGSNGPEAAAASSRREAAPPDGQRDPAPAFAAADIAILTRALT
ncbi:FUSC family protein [Nocardia sp. NPDC050697]|uniref:FUSC family protein n=1 Tax=Nocardia sp. NPDC050697 TaxID=3155158 RepID=UPI0033CDE10F